MALCRRVDWEHLDEITWPEFVLAYLAAAGFFSSAVHKKNFSQTLPRCEYYALPPEAKLEALSFLCDEALTSARIRKPVAEREGRQHDVSFRVTSATPTSSGGKATSPTTENNVTESGKKVTESGGAKGSGEIAGSKPPKVSPAGALRPARITGRLTRFAGKDGGEGTAAQGTDSLQNAAAVETSGGMIAVPAVKPSTESADPEGASQGAEEARQAGGAVGLVAADKTKVGHQNEPAIGLEDGAAANGVGRVGARTDAEGGAVASGEGSAGNRVGSSEPGGDGAADVASASTQGPDRNGARGGGTVPMGPSIAAATNSGETDRSKPEAGLQTHKDSTTPAAPNSSGQQLETPLPNTPGVYAPLPKPALATPSAFSFLKPSANPAATPKTPITQPPSTHPKPQTLPKPREDDSDDANLDECVLCGMEGNLLCCDGCPAAYHARCIGLGKAQLAEGEWFCPECRVTGVNRREPALLGERVEPLGTDPQGRAYWFAFGSVLM